MVVQLASPYDAQRIQQMAAQKAKFQPNPAPVAAPQKGPLQAVGEAAGADIAGKVGMKGADMAMTKLGTMFAPHTAAGAGQSLLAGPGAAAAGNLAGATGATGLAGAMPMMAAAAPWLAGAAVLGKAFKLFNMGGLVGPLGNLSKVKYKTHGGDVTHEYEINMGPLSKGE